MKRYIIVYFLCCFIHNLHAQTAYKAFHIDIPDHPQKVKNSLYNRIGIYDARTDTSNLGIVQSGLSNTISAVVAEPSLGVQLSGLINAYNDYSASKSDLLFHLRQFAFSEMTGFMNEKGFCYLRAGLYKRVTNGIYQKLDVIDTTILTSKTFDATHSILKNVEKTIKAFIIENLSKEPTDTTLYKTADIKYIENQEKSKIPLYNTAALKNGLYESYESFKLQAPDKLIEVHVELDNVKSVKAIGDAGKKVSVDPEEIYAIVYNGTAYKATEDGYYLLEKKKGDFFYVGKAKLTANKNRVDRSQYNFGLIGGLAAASEKAFFEMKIDHINGSSIRIKRTSPLGDIR